MRTDLLRRLLVVCALSMPWTLVIAIAAQDGAQQTAQVKSTRLGVPIAARQYMSESWGVVGVSVRNPGDETAEALATFGFSRDSDLSFSRRIRIPPRSVRRTWVPVKLPAVSRGNGTVDMFGLLIDNRLGSEVVSRPSHATVSHSSVLRVNHDVPVTCIYLADETVLQTDAAKMAYEAVIGLRSTRGYERRLVMFNDRHLPPFPEVLDGVDQLVLYNDRFANDAAAMPAIRAWVNEGGQLWIMLDRVELEGVERLLGNVFSCGLVDRVELDKVDIQVVNPRPGIEYTSEREYELPVEFARVVTTEMNVTHTVDQWPAAFWRSMGRGNVVFTTIGAKAWIQRAETRSGPWNPKTMTDYAPTPEMDDLPVILPRTQRSFSPEVLRPYLTEQIGYRVVPRTPVLTILGLFCMSLFAAGAYLSRSSRLERMGWFAPAATILAAVPLVWIGARAQHRVAPTVGQVQFIEAGEKDNEICASGMLAVYNPSPSTGPLGAGEGGVFQLDTSGLQGMKRRMVWTDLGQWHWENLKIPAGVRTATFKRSTVLDQPLKAIGTFTATGLEAKLTGPFATLSDALIAIPGQPHLAASVDGTVVQADAGDLLAPGQYVSGTLLSNEQTRRQSVYEQLLKSHLHGPIRRPTLMGWSAPLDMKFRFPDGVENVGAALWAIPLEMQRPASGTKVVIPSPLVRYAVVKGPGRAGTSALFDPHTGQWVRSSNSSRTWLRFQIPEEVLPIDLQRVRLTMEITAPNRIVQVVRESDGQVESLSSDHNPIGRVTVVIEPPSIPDLDEHGGVRLGIAVGTDADSSTDADSNTDKKNGWQIDWLQLEIAGQVR
jgi:hypothetical protein